MPDQKIKHLEFIQKGIERMTTLSFQLKGWCVTLVSALNVLAAKDVNQMHMSLVYFIVPIFWTLDAFYLSKERQYRGLYEKVRHQKETEIDFNMDTQIYNTGKNTWLRSALSKSQWPIYGTLLAVTIYYMFFC